jgi:hypothetical protein
MATQAEDDDLRAELKAACESVRRQMELQQRSQRSMFGGRGDAMARKALQDRLHQLEQALADIGSRD